MVSTIEYLASEEIIAINKEALAKIKVKKAEKTIIYAKRLKNG